MQACGPAHRKRLPGSSGDDFIWPTWALSAGPGSRSEVKADTERRESAERKDRQQGQLLQAQRLESLGQLAGGHTTDGAN